jgi:hypothetical protein
MYSDKEKESAHFLGNFYSMVDINLESKVIKRFIIKSKRDRFLSFISSDKNRDKFTFELAHLKDLDFKLFEEVKGDERKMIKDKIKVLPKLTDCYLISEDKELDRKRLTVDQALRETIGHGMGTLVVFGDAEIVFYEGEGPSNRWISKRVTV